MKRLHPSGVPRASLARGLLILLILCWSFGLIFPNITTKQALRQVIPSVRLTWAPPPSLTTSPTIPPKSSSTSTSSPSPTSPRHAFNTSKLALLIEPRPLPHLAPQILHMISVVPPDWRFLFLGSPESVFALARPQAIRHQRAVGKLELREVVAPHGIHTKEHVFRLLTDAAFYDEYLPGVEWLLKFEHDSLLCANAEVSLDEWLVWDWAGALRGDDRFAGHGGLSLRRISAIKRVLGFQARFPNSEPEDIWFGKRIPLLPGARVASRLDGVLSMEDVFVDRPMGYHVPSDGQFHGAQEAVWGDAGRRRAILEYCPELSIILDMKLERERCPDDDGEGHRAAGFDIFDIDWEAEEERELEREQERVLQSEQKEDDDDDDDEGEAQGRKTKANAPPPEKAINSPDVAVRVGVLDSQGVGVDVDLNAHAAAGTHGAAIALQPPQPPPLPRPWRDLIAGQDLRPLI